MLTVWGRQQAVCEGVSRRRLLQVGGAGLLGLSLPQVLAAEQAQSGLHGRAKSVIFLFLFGGPSQLETFDMKPDAPSTLRGPFRPIDSRTPGLRICEHLARTAEISDKLAIIRTMSHSYNDHSGAGHYIQTGHRWHLPIGGGFNVTSKDWPAMGSVVEYLSRREARNATREIPSYVVLPNSLGRLQEFATVLRRPGETAGWLGRGYDPLTTQIDKRDPKDNPYWRDCTDDELRYEIQGLVRQQELSLDRLRRRQSLLSQFDTEREQLASSSSLDVYDQFQQRALALVTSEKTRQALDITREPAPLRDRYGRHLFGQSALMARRLIEAGVRFATVHYDCPDGYSWDSHVTSADLQKHLIPTLDQALSALITDLHERGLLDETLVVAVGEIGRTPKATAQWGRGHWSTLFPAVLAGAGVRGGLLYGQSDKDAGYALDHLTTPEDLAATIYHALGVDPDLRLQDAQGRPTPILETGTPLTELFA